MNHHPKDDDHALDGDEVLARGVTLACRHPVAKYRLDLQGTKDATHGSRADLMTAALDPRDLAVAGANPLSEFVLSDAELGAEVDHLLGEGSRRGVLVLDLAVGRAFAEAIACPELGITGTCGD